MSSKLQLESIVLYLDRNLGNYVVAQKLREHGIQTEIHDDHLPRNAPDEDWIKLVSDKNWIGVTKDKRIRFRSAEINSVKSFKARLLVIRAKNARAIENADILIKSYNRICKFARKSKSPFIAGIDRSGKITNYKI